MRKILFHGKQLDNGEWVEGYYTETLRYNNLHWIWDGEGYISVDPATVGQYTGKTDKKHVKIFENHIVSFEWFSSTHTGKVVFNEKTCGFEIWFNTVVGTYGEKATHKINFSNIDNIEVIGNIHDNPDLLRE